MEKNVLIHRIIAILILFEVVFLMYQVYGDLTNSGVCESAGCDTVQNSAFSEIFGIKLIYIALVCFILLYIFYQKHPKLYRIAVVVGGLGAVTLIAIQYFVLDAWCRDCLIIDITMLVIVALSVYAGDLQKP